MAVKSFIFGYGTLINDESRLATLSLCSSSSHVGDATQEQVPAFMAEVSKGFGYRRSFCFQSATGFTALGLSADKDAPCGIQGVVFQVTAQQLVELDRREKGYFRALIPLDFITALPGLRGSDTHVALPEGSQVYTYIPEDERNILPTEDHPILQTYVDTCLSGCLAWGGEDMVKAFCLCTTGWSEFYLNDPPMSRRPWLHRPKCWEAIDAALASCAEHTRFMHRKHAEEYLRNNHGYTSTLSLRGMWGVPQRDRSFVGREQQLAELTSALQQGSMVQICGMGGMGKSTLASEHVQRQFGSGKYELVIFLHAETRTALANDLRKFAKEMLHVNMHLATSIAPSPSKTDLQLFDPLSEEERTEAEDEEFMAADFRRHLSNSQSSYVIIFDNLENTSWLSNYLPEVDTSGAGKRTAHVIITSRVARDLSSVLTNHCQTLQLDSLLVAESLQYLQRAVGDDESEAAAAEAAQEKGVGGRRLSRRSFSGTSAAATAIARLRCFTELAERLGHLPLALSMAAAYMNRCDVSAREYLERLGEASTGSVEDGSQQDIGSDSFFSPDAAITASVTMALDRIQMECSSATSTLQLLAFLAPDGITKALVLSLVQVGHFKSQGPQEKDLWPATAAPAGVRGVFGGLGLGLGLKRVQMCGSVVAACAVAASVCLAGRRFEAGHAAVAATALCGAAAAFFIGSRALAASSPPPPCPNVTSNVTPPSPVRSSSKDAAILTDTIWETLKIFGFFLVKGPRSRRIASVHRTHLAMLRRIVAANGAKATQLAVERCIWTLRHMWSYDSATAASVLHSHNVDLSFLDHINIVWSHVFQAGPGGSGATMPGTGLPAAPAEVMPLTPTARRNLAALLKEAGEYLAKVALNFDAAAALLQRALVLETSPEDLGNRNLTLLLLGKVDRLRGDLGRTREEKEPRFHAAKAHLEKCLAVGAACPTTVLAPALFELGLLELRLGRLSEARELFRRRSCPSLGTGATALEPPAEDDRVICLALSAAAAPLVEAAVALFLADALDECAKHGKIEHVDVGPLAGAPPLDAAARVVVAHIVMADEEEVEGARGALESRSFDGLEVALTLGWGSQHPHLVR